VSTAESEYHLVHTEELRTTYRTPWFKVGLMHWLF